MKEDVAMDLRLEVVVLPVSDVDRAKKFYQGLGWRLDADFPLSPTFRAVQLTPPGSACSVIFGTGVTTAKPGSAQGLWLVVDNIKAARNELNKRGAKVSEVFHRGAKGEQVAGPDPDNRSYSSLASFSDPDGNNWLLQEITERLPGRTTSPLAVYGTVDGFADALRRAEAAHGTHEKKLGKRDENWPEWYAQYLVDESTRQDAAA
jgi:catechol 2,3-dioxygenase-like lactoylglutathione lyase family enzyme